MRGDYGNDEPSKCVEKGLCFMNGRSRSCITVYGVVRTSLSGEPQGKKEWGQMEKG